MAKENPNTSDRTTETTKPEKGSEDNLKTARAVDNKLIEKQRLMDAQGFSVSDVGTNEIKQANQARKSAFQLVDDGQIIAAGKKPEAQAQAGRDKQLIAVKPAEIEIDTGVSPKRRAEVDHWWQSVPPYLREALLDSDCKCRIIVNVNLSPDLKKEASDAARGHNETLDQLPMFYSPSLKRIIFVDKASRTTHEQQVQTKVDTTIAQQERGGVQTYGEGRENLKNFDVKSLSYAGIERNGWHEMGHAFDQAVLHKFSGHPEFNAAFAEGVKSLSPDYRLKLSYFLNNKDELFAEVFAIEHTPENKRLFWDNVIVEHFSKLINLMHDKAQVKDRSGHKHSLF